MDALDDKANASDGRVRCYETYQTSENRMHAMQEERYLNGERGHESSLMVVHPFRSLRRLDRLSVAGTERLGLIGESEVVLERVWAFGKADHVLRGESWVGALRAGLEGQTRTQMGGSWQGWKALVPHGFLHT